MLKEETSKRIFQKNHIRGSFRHITSRQHSTHPVHERILEKEPPQSQQRLYEPPPPPRRLQMRPLLVPPRHPRLLLRHPLPALGPQPRRPLLPVIAALEPVEPQGVEGEGREQPGEHEDPGGEGEEPVGGGGAEGGVEHVDEEAEQQLHCLVEVAARVQPVVLREWLVLHHKPTPCCA
ncbi:unnamed protein product, partial [Closterium sp. NIES-54]